MAPLPGLSTLKPGSATRALPGLRTLVVDEDGEPAINLANDNKEIDDVQRYARYVLGPVTVEQETRR